MAALTIVRVLYGSALLLAPDSLIGEQAGRSERAFARILGARHLVQAALAGPRPTPRLLRVGAAIDAIHAATMIALTVWKPRHCALASANALAAASFAGAGIFAAKQRDRLNG
jgi:hypothetical protein